MHYITALSQVINVFWWTDVAQNITEPEKYLPIMVSNVM
jgi:hypothetical protein